MNKAKILFTLFSLFIIWMLALIFHAMLADEYVFATRGETARGEVLDKYKKRSKRSGSGNSSISYSMKYKYSVDGKSYQNEDMLDVGRGYDDLSRGQIIQIVYDPQDPSIARSKISVPIVRYILISIFVLIFATAFIVMAYLWYRKSLKKTELVSDYSTVSAEIIRPVGTSVTVNKKPMYRIIYRYTDYKGVEHVGKSCYLGAEYTSDLKMGDIVQARYSNKDPRISAVEAEFIKLGLA